MARDALSVQTGTINTKTTVYGLAGSSSNGTEVVCDDMSKLFLLVTSSDVAAHTIVFKAGSSGADWIQKGVGDWTTSVSASTWAAFCGFESNRFKTTNKSLWIDYSSTGSTCLTWYGFLMP